MSLDRFLKWCALVAVVGGFLGGTLTFADQFGFRPVLKREVDEIVVAMEATSKSVLLLQFQLLIEKQKMQPLTFEEQKDLCRIADILGYTHVPGCD